MDETPESEDDPSPSDGGAPSRSGASRRKRDGAPAARSAPAAAREGSTRAARRWWEQPWLWLGIVVLVVAGAVGASVVIGSDPDDITPSGNTTAFCASVESYRQVRDKPLVPGADGVDQYSRLVQSLEGVERDSGEEIRPTVAEIRATADEILRYVRDQNVKAVSINELLLSDQKITAIENRAQRATGRFDSYVKRACGFDPEASSERAPAATGSVPPVAGSVVPSGPGPTPSSSAPPTPTGDDAPR